MTASRDFSVFNFACQCNHENVINWFLSNQMLRNACLSSIELRTRDAHGYKNYITEYTLKWLKEKHDFSIPMEAERAYIIVRQLIRRAEDVYFLEALAKQYVNAESQYMALSGYMVLICIIDQYLNDPNIRKIISYFASNKKKYIGKTENELLQIALEEHDSNIIPRKLLDNFTVRKEAEKNFYYHHKKYLLSLVFLNEPIIFPDIKSPSTICNLPNRNPHFTGRANILKTIESSLKDNSRGSSHAHRSPYFVNIKGKKGIGKTQIAKEYAHLHENEYDIIWYIDAPDGVNYAYKMLAKQLNNKFGETININGGCDVFIRYFKDFFRCYTGSYLIIFDGQGDEYDYMRDDFPHSSESRKAHIITCSSRTNINESSNTIYVGEFTRDESIKYIKTFFGLKSSTVENEEATNELASILCDSPLALTQAMTFMKANKITIAGYIEAFKKDFSLQWKKEQQALSQMVHLTLDDQVKLIQIILSLPNITEKLRQRIFIKMGFDKQCSNASDSEIKAKLLAMNEPEAAMTVVKEVSRFLEIRQTFIEDFYFSLRLKYLVETIYPVEFFDRYYKTLQITILESIDFLINVMNNTSRRIEAQCGMYALVILGFISKLDDVEKMSFEMLENVLKAAFDIDEDTRRMSIYFLKQHLLAEFNERKSLSINRIFKDSVNDYFNNLPEDIKVKINLCYKMYIQIINDPKTHENTLVEEEVVSSIEPKKSVELISPKSTSNHHEDVDRKINKINQIIKQMLDLECKFAYLPKIEIMNIKVKVGTSKHLVLHYANVVLRNMNIKVKIKEEEITRYDILPASFEISGETLDTLLSKLEKNQQQLPKETSTSSLKPVQSTNNLFPSYTEEEKKINRIITKMLGPNSLFFSSSITGSNIMTIRFINNRSRLDLLRYKYIFRDLGIKVKINYEKIIRYNKIEASIQIFNETLGTLLSKLEKHQYVALIQPKIDYNNSFSYFGLDWSILWDLLNETEVTSRKEEKIHGILEHILRTEVKFTAFGYEHFEIKFKVGTPESDFLNCANILSSLNIKNSIAGEYRVERSTLMPETISARITISDEILDTLLSKLEKYQQQLPKETSPLHEPASLALKSPLFSIGFHSTPKKTSPLQKPTSLASTSPLFGLRFHPILGDGHCLYAAVGLYMNEDVSFIRNIVAANLEANLTEYEGIIRAMNPGRSAEEYINAVRSGVEWGTNLELAVLMKVLDRPIYVVGPDNELRNYVDLHGKGEPLFVKFNGINHYDSFVLSGERSAWEIANALCEASLANRQPKPK